MAYTTGLTVFNISPGEIEEIYCNVCESKCEVKRDVYWYRDFASAMAKRKTKFDQFICPHAGEEWHKKLEKIVVQRKENHSSKIDQLLQEEIEEIKAGNLG